MPAPPTEATQPPPISFATVAKRSTSRSGGPRPKETRYQPMKMKITYYSMIHLTGEHGTKGDEELRLPPREIVNGTSKHSIIINASDYKTGNDALAAVMEIRKPAAFELNARTKQMLLSFDTAEEADYILRNPPTLDGIKVKVTRPISRTENMAIVNIRVVTEVTATHDLIQMVEKQLTPWGTLCDISIGMGNGIPSKYLTAILDLGDSEKMLPAKLASANLISYLYGRMVTKYCNYCKKEGHHIKSCEHLKAKKTVDNYNARSKFTVGNSQRSNEAGGPPINPPKSRAIKTASTKRSRVTIDEGLSSGDMMPSRNRSNLINQRAKGLTTSSQEYNKNLQAASKSFMATMTTQAETLKPTDSDKTAQNDKGKKIDYFEDALTPAQMPKGDNSATLKVMGDTNSKAAKPETVQEAAWPLEGKHAPSTCSKKTTRGQASRESMEKGSTETEVATLGGPAHSREESMVLDEAANTGALDPVAGFI
ncbi:hypothetical protein GGI23_003696 [Coemansia sp. RSA 2559]|nr:hypothetical protein GGI23_003696 [Coemansia sp. RSA 2559]KAJ2858803.1 hypothetical protein GGI22_003226 [Coemansia erecta]